MQSPPTKIRGKRPVVAAGSPGIERADNDGLGIFCAEFPKQRLSRFFDKTRRILRTTRPTVMNRQIPPHEFGDLRVVELLRIFKAYQAKSSPKPLQGFGSQTAKNVRLGFVEDLGDANQPSGR